MRMKLATALAMLAGAQMVAGCQSTRWHGAATSTPHAPMITSATAPDAGAAQLAAGREALDAGNVSAAVTAFRNAKLFPEHAAAAYNGLAVAYSRIGRSDLTERFFRQAIALAPENERFAENLARFERKHGALQQAEAPSVLAAAVPQTDPAVPVRVEARPRIIRIAPGVVAEAPASRMTRLSAYEVRIGGGSASGATNPAMPVRRLAVLGASSERPHAYPLRVALPGSEQPAGMRPVYPVRVMLAGSGR